MSYGPDLIDLDSSGRFFRIENLRGTPPSDLPVERPTKFELVVNLKAAKSLGVTLPNSLLTPQPIRSSNNDTKY